MALTTTARPVAGSAVTWSWQALLPFTAAACGHVPSGKQMHERLGAISVFQRRPQLRGGGLRVDEAAGAGGEQAARQR